MKKLKFVFSVLLVLIVFSSCNSMDNSSSSVDYYDTLINNMAFDDSILDDGECKTIIDETGEEVISFDDDLLKGELAQCDLNNLKIWDYSVNDHKWNINGKNFSEQCTFYLSLYRKSLWKVDLTQFEATGYGADSTIFYKTIYTDALDILVADKNGKLYLLVGENLDFVPKSYTIDNFKVILPTNITEKELLDLWELHLATEEDNVIHLLDGNPNVVRLRLKSNPALVYEFDYYYYKGAYHPSSPKSLCESGDKTLATKRDLQ